MRRQYFTTSATLIILLSVSLTGLLPEAQSAHRNWTDLPEYPCFTKDKTYAKVGETVEVEACYTINRAYNDYYWGVNQPASDASVSRVSMQLTFSSVGTHEIHMLAVHENGLKSRHMQTIDIIPAGNVTPTERPTPLIQVNDHAGGVGYIYGRTGEAITFDATPSSHPTSNLRARWSFDNGPMQPTQYSTNLQYAHTFNTPGLHTVTLDIATINSPTTSAKATWDLWIEDASNEAPTACFTTNRQTATPGTSIYFDGSCSTDPENKPLKYRWKIDNGLWEGPYTNDPVMHRSWTSLGTKTIDLRVLDEHGKWHEYENTITIVDTYDGTPPSPTITEQNDKTTGSIGETFTFTGAANDPDPNDNARYAWDWGDGSRTPTVGSTTIETTQKSWAAKGTYIVTLTVTDDANNQQSAQYVVTIDNQKPTASYTLSRNQYTVNVDASASSDPENNIQTYHWSFGDGNADTGVTSSHTYAVEGTYTITLTVTDTRGAKSIEKQTLTIHRDFNIDFTYCRGAAPSQPTCPGTTDTFHFEAQTTHTGPNYQVTWNWGDGSVDSTGYQASHTYQPGNQYRVTATLIDRTDPSDIRTTYTSQIIIFNQAPIADFTATINEYRVTVDAAASRDPENKPLEYEWRFGDGETTTGISRTSHTYSEPGNYRITLIVTDNLNVRDTHFEDIQIKISPVAKWDYITNDKELKVNAGASFTGTGTTITNYQWIWGDGDVSNGVTATHTYNQYQNYTVLLRVTNSDGNTDEAIKIITIHNQPPDIQYQLDIDELNVTVNAQGSSDPDGDTLTFTWDWGDGTSNTGPIHTHQYPSQGTYTINLTVTDTGNNYHRETRSVTLGPNQSPTAAWTYTQDKNTIKFDASASSDADRDFLTFNWDLGNGEATYGQRPIYNYPEEGTYTVTLTVLDDKGASSTATNVIIVNEINPNTQYDQLKRSCDTI